MKALILAAGYGTRLYPLTIDRPKPLLEVGGKSILERLLEKVAAATLCDVVYIVTNARFHEAIEKWSSEHSFKFSVDVVNDMTTSNDDRLGAIGDIDLVLKTKGIKDDVLIMAGDNLFEFDIKDFISFAGKKGHLSVALFDVKDTELARRYGIVSLDKQEMVIDFQEKPAEPKTTLASTGIYYLPADKVTKIAKYMHTGKSKDAPGNFVKWMAENDKVFGYVFTEGWYDIGDIASLNLADAEYKKKGL